MPRLADWEPMTAPVDLAEQEAVPPPVAALPGLERGLFQVRPSAWYVLLEGWPTWAAAGTVMAAVVAAHRWSGWMTDATRDVTLQCGAALILLRVIWDSLRWAGTTFLLTDRRAVAQRGLTEVEVTAVSLDELEDVSPERSWPQRLTGTATLAFRVEGVRAPMMIWEHVSEPLEVREAILSARRRMRGRRGASM